MPESASKRALLSLFFSLWLGLIVALTASGFDQYFKIDTLERGDQAVNALQIDNAGQFRELYGNYSRFEFNHPGPAFFYTYAAGEAVFYKWLHLCPAPGNAHLLTSMWLQAAFFAAALTLLSAHFPWKAFLPLALLAAVFQLGPLQQPFMSIWPPHVLTMPFLCFLTACCSVAAGRFPHLIIATVSGGFLFHGHVAQPLFVGSLGLLALITAYWREQKQFRGRALLAFVRTHRGTLIACGGITALFLLPLAIDLAVNRGRSNVATILGVFSANTSDSKSIWQSFLYFVSFGTTAGNQEDVFTTLGPQVGEFFRTYRLAVILWATTLVAPIVLLVVWRSRPIPSATRTFLLAAHGFLLVTIGLCVVWGTAQAGGMANFNGFFYYGVYYFALLLVIARLADWVDRFAPPAVVAAFLAIAAVGFTWSFRLPRLSPSETGIPIRDGVSAALNVDRSGRPKLLVFEHRFWPEVASVALDLQRRGFDYYVNPWWDFMFGERRRFTHLGADPEDLTQVWWITHEGPGESIADGLYIHPEAAPLKADGAEINFQGLGNAFRYVVAGISTGNIEHAWTELPRISVMMKPEPSNRDVELIFDAQSNRPETVPQPADVYFNEKLIGRVVATTRSELRITVPQALWNSRPTARLELHFPGAMLVQSARRPRYEWHAAWALWAIRTQAK